MLTCASPKMSRSAQWAQATGYLLDAAADATGGAGTHGVPSPCGTPWIETAAEEDKPAMPASLRHCRRIAAGLPPASRIDTNPPEP
jgi:hypothetical protein